MAANRQWKIQKVTYLRNYLTNYKDVSINLSILQCASSFGIGFRSIGGQGHAKRSRSSSFLTFRCIIRSTFRSSTVHWLIFMMLESIEVFWNMSDNVTNVQVLIRLHVKVILSGSIEKLTYSENFVNQFISI